MWLIKHGGVIARHDVQGQVLDILPFPDRPKGLQSRRRLFRGQKDWTRGGK